MLEPMGPHSGLILAVWSSQHGNLGRSYHMLALKSERVVIVCPLSRFHLKLEITCHVGLGPEQRGEVHWFLGS